MAPKSRTDYELQTATAIGLTGNEVQMGGVINVAEYDTLTIFVNYTKGTESGVYVYGYFHRRLGAGAHQLGEWTAPVGVKTFTNTYFHMTASGRYYVTLDITGQNLMTLYNVAVSGAATGKVAASILLTEEGM